MNFIHEECVPLLQPSATVEGELVKAAAEVKHLREEESLLRQENLQLKVCFEMLQLNVSTSALYWLSQGFPNFFS
jgi:hypothetical protein